MRRIQPFWFTAGGIVLMVIMVFPLYWTLKSALETNEQIFATPPAFFPESPTLEAFKEALAVQGPNILTSIIIACGTVILSIIISAPAGYALAKFKFRFTRPLLFGVLMTQMVPSVILANALFVIFHKINLTNNYFGIILADCSLSIPFNILVLRTFMAKIPTEIMEAAAVDGASDWKIFFRIIIPVSKSALITVGLFSFLFAWGDFLFALTIMTDSAIQPVTVSIYTFMGVYTSEWNNVMATAVLASIPASILLMFAQRYIAAGMTNGAVKG
ncbi:carbohydrate ABC transporter permease [Neobacillus muris]|uniref:carbohydrate ABC transporter permease n=1 Tax=Neobacillus muris TaxID=2941334 RepID=UPI00203B2F76|nr:carbohydrate ABC transporter permease [Neobacillus muris]